jgi:zinc protease
VNAGVALGELSASAFGSTRPADLETTMQLLYLKLTAPRHDERAFARWKAQQIEFERHRKESPEQQFFDAMTELQTQNHLRRRPPNADMIAAVDLDKTLGVWKSRFSDLGAFTFVFVGNLDLAKLQPLVETYLGSLPAKGRKEKWRDVGVKQVRGKVTKTVVAGTEPKSHVSITFSGDDKWTLDAERDARVLQMGLRMRLREVLREDMGGVYGVSISGGLAREPKPRRSFTVSFGCDPDNVDKLSDAVFAEIAKIQKEGLADTYVAKIDEQLRRAHEVDLKENRYWMGLLRSTYYYGDDFKALADVEAIIKRATAANIKAAALRFFDDKNVVIGVLKPKPASTAAAP